MHVVIDSTYGDTTHQSLYRFILQKTVILPEFIVFVKSTPSFLPSMNVCIYPHKCCNFLTSKFLKYSDYGISMLRYNQPSLTILSRKAREVLNCVSKFSYLQSMWKDRVYVANALKDKRTSQLTKCAQDLYKENTPYTNYPLRR